MDTPDQAADGGDWRMQLKDMRTIAALRADDPSREAAERLTDRVLTAAAQNPDHSESGRVIAAAAARARNVSVTPWRLSVPGFLTAADLAKGQRLFFGWGWRMRVWSGVLAVIAGVLLAALYLSVAARIAGAGDDLLISQLAMRNAVVAGPFGAIDWPILLIASAFLLVPALVWLLATLLRRKPARVAVFAPPQHALTRAPLRRFVRKELRAFGHVLLHEADGPIRSAAAYRAAASLMANKLAMNLRAMRLSGVSLRIGGAGGWAPFTRALGEGSANAVIVDLSQDAESALAALGADPARCIFVALWGRLETAQAALAARGVSAIVHHYAPDGEIQRRAPFRAAMLQAMGA